MGWELGQSQLCPIFITCKSNYHFWLNQARTVFYKYLLDAVTQLLRSIDFILSKSLRFGTMEPITNELFDLFLKSVEYQVSQESI